MLPISARMDLRAMTIKGFSAFPQTQSLLELHYQIEQTLIGGALPFGRDVVGIFYSPQPTDPGWLEVDIDETIKEQFVSWF